MEDVSNSPLNIIKTDTIFMKMYSLNLLGDLACSLSFSRLMFYCIKVLIVMMVVEIQARWLISAVKHLFIMCTDEMKSGLPYARLWFVSTASTSWNVVRVLWDYFLVI